MTRQYRLPTRQYSFLLSLHPPLYIIMNFNPDQQEQLQPDLPIEPSMDENAYRAAIAALQQQLLEMQQTVLRPPHEPKVPINKPPVLKEKMKNEDVDNWIGQIRNWIRMQEEFLFHRSLTEYEKVRLVSSYLEGDPFDCWMESVETFTLEQQFAEINRRYTDLDWMETKKARFDSMRQKGSARAFARDLQTLSRKLDPIPSDEQLIRRFRDGLREDVRNALDIQLVRPTSVPTQEYVLRAIANDDVLYRHHRKGQLNTKPEQLNAISEKKGKGKGKGKRDLSKVTCYSCNKTGHYKSDCPSKK
jgi:hypothetical protein